MLRKIPFLILSAILFARSSALAQEAGVTWTGAPGITEKVSAIMARESTNATLNPGQIHVKPRFVREQNNLPQNPQSPLTHHWPSSDQHGIQQFVNSGAFVPQTLGTNFLGATLADSGFVPPDSQGDIGPSQFLVCVNGRIRVFDRQGNVGALDTTPEIFFASLSPSGGCSDPHVRYDRLSQRWFIVMIDIPKNNNQVLIAVSSGPTITNGSSFTFFSFKPSVVTSADHNLFADYPTLGIDNNALYIGANLFGSRFFSHTSGYVVRKTNLLSGTLTVTAFSGLASGSGAGLYTPQGVDNDDPSATEGYFIGTDNAVFGQLDLRRISNPGGTPTISTNIIITVPATASPLGVSAQGTTTSLDALDDRLFQARIHHGSLWTAHNIQVDASGVASSSGGRDGSRWYEITNFTGTPGLRQSGTVFDSSASNPTNYWIPTCAISGQGNVALGCSAAGVNEHAEIAVAGRFQNDTLGTLQTPAIVQSSSSTYNVNDGATPHRWGDYSAVSVDPNDDMTFWTIQEYCNTNNSWAVRVIQLQAPPPSLPISCNPNSVTAGTTTNITIIGLSTNGSGFFDPGANYSNHISASISGNGDLTVNSVTYNNPTNLTLNVSVSPTATANVRTITVTNPDGQSVTSASLLTVIGTTNAPPVANFSASPTNGAAPLTVTFANSSSNATSYNWNFGDGQISVSANPVHIYTNAGSFTVTLTAIGTGGTNNFSRANYIVVTNLPPVANFSGGPTNGAAPLTVTFTNSSSGATNYNWNFGDGQISASANPAHIYTNTGNFTVTLNAIGLGGTNVFLRANYIVVTNAAPVLSPISNKTINELTTLTLTNIATDADGDTLTFSLDAGAPTNATIDSASGIFSWTPAEAQGPSTNSITVRVTDNGVPPLSATQSFTITVNEVNSAPILSSISNKTILETTTLMFTNTAADSDIPTNTLTFSLDAGAPTNATINSATGIFSWTPAEAQGPSTNSITVRVTDNGVPPLSTTQSFTVVVLESNLPPALAPIADRTIHVGTTVTITNSASDPDVPANVLTFSLTNFPAGATINPTNGIFTWTPGNIFTNTTNNVTVAVTDFNPWAVNNQHLSDSKTFHVIVKPPPSFLTSQPPVSFANGLVTISWGAISGQTYRVQYNQNLSTTNWTDLLPDVTATNSTASKTDLSGATTNRFYRVFPLP